MDVLQSAFFPSTVAVKLLKGQVQCPQDPSDPLYDAFGGNPKNASALLQANALSMTMTNADDRMLQFSVPDELKQWVAEVGQATICLTQEGLEDPSDTCWENEMCTMRLGYMRWTGKKVFKGSL